MGQKSQEQLRLIQLIKSGELGTEGRKRGPSRVNWKAARFWSLLAVMAAVAYGSLFYAWWPQ